MFIKFSKNDKKIIIPDRAYHSGHCLCILITFIIIIYKYKKISISMRIEYECI